MMAKYKMIIYATAIFHKVVEVDAKNELAAYAKARDIYQDADVCEDWVCDDMDYEIEELNDD